MNGVAVLVLLVLAIGLVAAQGGFGGDHGGLDHGHHHLEEYIDYRAKPRYHWDYHVHDPHTHDIKHQWEHRDGKETKGEYSLLQPDGRKRIVEYVAGKHGADYRIKYEGHSKHGGIGSFSIGI